mmetsp:Transcript_20548/g.51735  ORF Transcript_20548/g.51735 Transcript_20548/m.51735 type:complete len:296 (-) Transcript_20548:105-992(-)
MAEEPAGEGLGRHERGGGRHPGLLLRGALCRAARAAARHRLLHRRRRVGLPAGARPAAGQLLLCVPRRRVRHRVPLLLQPRAHPALGVRARLVGLPAAITRGAVEGVRAGAARRHGVGGAEPREEPPHCVPHPRGAAAGGGLHGAGGPEPDRERAGGDGPGHGGDDGGGSLGHVLPVAQPAAEPGLDARVLGAGGAHLCVGRGGQPGAAAAQEPQGGRLHLQGLEALRHPLAADHLPLGAPQNSARRRQPHPHEDGDARDAVPPLLLLPVPVVPQGPAAGVRRALVCRGAPDLCY